MDSGKFLRDTNAPIKHCPPIDLAFRNVTYSVEVPKDTSSYAPLCFNPK